MKIHPYAEVFPLLEGEAFDELVADIRTHGLREPIWTFAGRILDGRNRYRACQKAGIDPDFRAFEGTDAAALALVVSANMHRRQLTDVQRQLAAARITSLSVGANQHTEGVSIETASKAMKVSTAGTKRAKKVIEKGSKPLQQAVEKGEIAISKAASVTHLPKAEQLKAAQEKPAAKPLEVEPEPEFHGYEPDSDEDFHRNIENVLMADDKLLAMLNELKQVRGELAAMRASRDHFQRQAAEAVKLVKARDREIAALKRQKAAA